MFTLKKIISAFLMPLGFGFLLGLIGLFFLFRASYTKAKIFLSLSFIVIFLSSYNPVANSLLHHLESKYPKIENIDKNIKYAILLGGDFEKRAYGILEIYHQNKNIIIITSGYEGNEKEPEAIINKRNLLRLGINENQIITQDKPKDTKEEAIQLKKTIGEEPFYLVTSAYHMPRALAHFQNENLNPIPYPIGYEERETKYIKYINASEADKTQKAIHEYIGSFWTLIKNNI